MKFSRSHFLTDDKSSQTLIEMKKEPFSDWRQKKKKKHTKRNEVQSSSQRKKKDSDYSNNKETQDKCNENSECVLNSDKTLQEKKHK